MLVGATLKAVKQPPSTPHRSGLIIMTNGKYKTENGSTVEISGKHSGISSVVFDWLEEDACVDCEVEPYPEEFDKDDLRLIWRCEYCGGGNAKLQKTTIGEVSEWPKA